jgi:hypothetical protein
MECIVMKKLYRLIQVLVLILIGLAPTMSSKAQSDSAVDSAGGPQDRIDVVLTADPAPAPTEITSLTLQATPHLAAPDLEITWLVPDGVELLGDATEQVGSVTARQTITSQKQIRFPGEGTYKIVASAVYHPAPGAQFAASGVLFYQIDAHGSRVSDRDPDAQSAMGTKLAAEITTSSHLTGPTSVDGDACFTVNGNIQRIDRPPTTSGYGSDVIVPVHNAIIEVWEEDDASFDDSYGTTLTDSNGNFSKSVCDGDGAVGGDRFEF